MLMCCRLRSQARISSQEKSSRLLPSVEEAGMAALSTRRSKGYEAALRATKLELSRGSFSCRLATEERNYLAIRRAFEKEKASKNVSCGRHAAMKSARHFPNAHQVVLC